jgi:hypothetical protein
MRGALVLAALAACGFPRPQTDIDAAPPDAPIDAAVADAAVADAAPIVDAAEPDAPRVITRIAFYERGAPIAGASALVHGPDGAPVTAAITDETGVAAFANVLPGSSLTVGKVMGVAPAIYPRVVTVFDVQPGDYVRVGDSRPRTTTSIAVHGSPLSGVTSFVVGTGCGYEQIVPGSDLDRHTFVMAGAACRRDGEWTVVALALSGSTPVKYAVARTSAQIARLVDWIDVTPTSGFAALTASYVNVPAGTGRVQLAFDFPFPPGSFTHGIVDGVPASRTFRYPPGAVEAIDVTAEALVDDHGSLVRRAVTGATHQFNLGAELLPIPAEHTVDSRDAERPALTWTAAPAGIDMVTGDVGWSQRYTWRFYAPPGATAVRFPAIPDTHLELVPPSIEPGAGFHSQIEYVATDADGWDAARQEPVTSEVRQRSWRRFEIH